MLDYFRPDEGKYVILESFTNTPHKTIHVIYFDDQVAELNEDLEFYVGRDNNMQIRITDISVSRSHAKISFYNDEFYVKDNESKFGTLILLQSPFPIPYLKKWSLTLQIGKYLSKNYFLKY